MTFGSICVCLWTQSQKPEGENFVKSIFYVINEKNSLLTGK
jgi:hypothetical protein